MLTNEEERVALYSRADLTTVPSEVTKDTNLENLNLNWREKELPEKERTKHVHRLHPYLGKFIPQLVEIFLRKYFSPGQTVLDPFCGSGTTLVQANELGINSIGYDVSAFNVLLTRTKTAKYDLVKVRKEVMDIFNKTRDISQPKSQQLCIWEESSPTWLLKETDDPYLQQWFAPQARRELLVYRQLIESEGYEYQSLLKIILSRSARSARLTTHFDLDFPRNPQTEPYWCYKHSRLCQPTTEALKFLKRYSLDTIKRLEEFSVRRTDAVAIACHADSRKTAPPPIDGVITSPPYVGLIDYHEQHAYAYHLLGLEDKREREIGAAANGSSQKAQRQYQQDISEVFRNALDSMPAGSRLIVIAGDKANLYGQIADFIGVEVEAIVQRHVNRRTGRRSGEFYESVFIWRKR
jgi:DNA modification methylase